MSTQPAVSADSQAVEPRRSPSSREALVVRWRGQGALVLLVVLVLAGAALVDGFATKSNLISVLRSQAYIGIVATGMTWVVLSKNFVDLSVPVAVAIAANVVLLVAPTSVALAVALALALPVALGLVNGLLVGRLNLNPVVVTLGTAGIAGGILFLATGGTTSIGQEQGLSDFASSKPLGVPLQAIAFVVLIVVNQIALSRTSFGARVRFCGSNPEAARASGVRPVRIAVVCFCLSAALAGLAGLLLGASSNFAQNTTGRGYEFDALAAVVVGGTLLRGGVGSFWRTLFGVLVIAVGTNIALLLGLSGTAQLLVRGLIFIVVVAVDALSTRFED